MAKCLRTFTIAIDVSEQFDAYAHEHNLAMSNIVEDLMREFLAKIENTQLEGELAP